jgi:prophage regulatory protein
MRVNTDTHTVNTETHAESLLSLKEVCERVPGKPDRSTVWRWVHRGIFPPPLRFGLRKLAWRASDIKRWIAERR